MRILDSKIDAALIIALVVSGVVVLQQPLRFVTDAARDVEGARYLDVAHGITLLTAAIGFLFYRSRQQTKTAEAVSIARAEYERVHSTELQPLVAFSRALGDPLGPPAVPQMFWR